MPGRISVDYDQEDATAENNADFHVIRFVARIVLGIIKQCWAMSGAVVLAVLFLYWMYGGILAFLALCFAATGIIYNAGDKLLYYPDTPPHSRLFVPAPFTVGLPFENVFFKTKDSVKLHGFLMKQPDGIAEQVPTILFLHGNAGNIGHRLPNARGLYRQLGCNIFMVEYRGYGKSDGHPSEKGLYLDAQAALDYLHNRSDIPRDKIMVFGRSLGGAVAIDLAIQPSSESKIACLLVENSFTSIPDMAKLIVRMKAIQYIPRWFYKNKYNSLQKVANLCLPCIFISGLMDELVPPSMMLDLYRQCGSPHKRLVQVPRGNHNGTWACPGYYRHLAEAVEQVMQTVRPSSRLNSEAVIEVTGKVTETN
nr:EOG090X09ZU [Triops cancriformis]